MATKASKYVLEIAAQYSGDSDLKRLQGDLNAIGKIDSYNKITEQWQKLNKEFASAKQRARELRTEMRQSGDSATAKQYAAAAMEVERLGKALDSQRSKLSASNKDLRDAGIAASKTAEQYKRLQNSLQLQGRATAARNTLGIRSDGSIQREIAGLQRAYRDLASSGKASIGELNRAKQAMNARIKELTGSTSRWGKSLLTTNNLLRGAALGVGIGMMGRYAGQIAKVADEYGQLDAKIRLTVNSEAEAAQVKQRLYQISQQTGTAFAANADAYAKLGMSLKDVGVGSEQTVGIIDMINKSLIVNGSTAEMAASFQLQFAQAMGSGVLQGDEFRAMLESNGFFAANLAKTLGVNIAGLREMSKAGELTSDVLLKAFSGMANEINTAFEKMPMTTGRAMQVLRNSFGALDDESNKASGSTGKIAASLVGLSAVIDANREPLTELIAGMMNLGASAVEVAAKIGEFATVHGELLADIAKYTLIFGGGIKMLTMFAGALLQIHAAATLLGGAKLAAWAAGVAGQMRILANSATIAGTAMRGTLALAAAQGVINIARLGIEVKGAVDAHRQAKKASDRLAESQARLAERYKEISQATGVTIRSHQDLVQAIKDGRIHQDESTREWVAGAGKKAEAERKAMEGVKKATGDALKEMQKKYQDYAKEVQRIQGEMAGRQRSLTAELREMGRSGMSDTNAWKDQKKEAEEYMAAAKRAAEGAKQAMAAGDNITAKNKFAEAVQYADDAKAAYKALNTEVKEGDQVVISKADALKTAMDGVKQAGELGIGILKQQQETIYKTMDDLVGKSGFADLTEGMDEAEKKWLEGWQRMRGAGEEAVAAVSQEIVAQQKEIQVVEAAWASAAKSTRGLWVQLAEDLQKKLDAATKPRTVTVYTNVIEKKSTGGLAGAARLALGGKLAGYGGGDRIPALLEAGEFVVRKEAVAKFGSGVFDALNSLRLPDLSNLLPRRMADGGMVSGGEDWGTINLNFGGSSIALPTTRQGARELRSVLAAYERGRSGR